MTKKMGISWNLRERLEQHCIHSTAELVPRLAERGVHLSRMQVYRLVAQEPQRISVDVLAALCDVLGAPGLAKDPGFATNALRVHNRDRLRDELERHLRARSAASWAEVLRAARVPAGPVNDLRAAFRLAAELGLAPIVALPRDDGSTIRLTRNPITLSATPPTHRAAPPPLPQPWIPNSS